MKAREFEAVVAAALQGSVVERLERLTAEAGLAPGAWQGMGAREFALALDRARRGRWS